MVSESEKTLFDSLKNGSDEAFKKVYIECRPVFVNFAKRYNIAADDILDIYQDAYIVLHENVINGKLKEMRSSVATYLISIGKYMIMDRLRKDKKKAQVDSILSVTGEVDEAVGALDLSNEPLDQTESKLKVAMEKLGKKCQEILMLFYYRKYSIKEIMVAGNYSNENVVKSQKSRCLRSLKELVNTPTNNG